MRPPRRVLAGRTATVAVAFAMSVAACGGQFASATPSDAVIDGWLVGPPTECQDLVVYENDVVIERGRCTDLVSAAAAALDHRDPGHPGIVAMQLHRRVWPPNTAGGLQYVAVYSFVDGSVSAIGVGWPGVATTPYTIDYGP